MSELTLTGKLTLIKETEVISPTFSKREFAIKTDELYPQDIKFEVTQKKVDMIDDYKVGEDITVFFNVRGREWINKQNEVVHFISLNAWRIEKENKNSSTAP